MEKSDLEKKIQQLEKENEILRLERRIQELEKENKSLRQPDDQIYTASIPWQNSAIGSNKIICLS